MKNWRTTLAGAIAGGTIIIDSLIQAWQVGAFNGKHGEQLALGIVVIAWGALQKDHNVTGGTK